MDSGKPLTMADRNGTPTIELATPIANDKQSAHLRVVGKEQDAGYRVEGGQLVWQKTLYEPRTTIVLPAGWEPTAVSAPATIATGRDGRVTVQIYNPRVEPLAVAIRAVHAS